MLPNVPGTPGRYPIPHTDATNRAVRPALRAADLSPFPCCESATSPPVHTTKPQLVTLCVTLYQNDGYGIPSPAAERCPRPIRQTCRVPATPPTVYSSITHMTTRREKSISAVIYGPEISRAARARNRSLARVGALRSMSCSGRIRRGNDLAFGSQFRLSFEIVPCACWAVGCILMLP